MLRYRRVTLIGSLSLLMLVGASFAMAFAQEGNPPSVECGEGVLFNKFDFQDGDIDVGDSVPLTDSNTTPEQLITLTKTAPLTYAYVLDADGLVITKIVVKGGSDSNDVTAITGTIVLPANISHVTFCFGTAGPPVIETTPPVIETTPPVIEASPPVVLARPRVTRPTARPRTLAQTGPGLAGVAGAGIGLLGTGLSLVAGGRRREYGADPKEISLESLQARIGFYDMTR